MSFFAVYTVSEHGEPVEGSEIATNTGWLNWCEWVDTHAADYPDCARLAQKGWIEAGITLEDLEEELARMAKEQDDANLYGVTATVAEAVKDCPEGASAIIVTDGEPDDDDDDEGDANSDPPDPVEKAVPPPAPKQTTRESVIHYDDAGRPTGVTTTTREE